MNNNLIQTDAVLSLIILVTGLVSTVEDFNQKLILIGIALGMVLIRSYLKSKRK
jgi:hypothetical protein